ncbi:helix-turn-helix transcriptional regulator [Brevundimonas sp. DC300-4]|uniref:helix-turn-helix transcriptional regulator n=1 Tax=Brevundimonas sp. DC300-4 TaxID=2804594 RepID=UPI003CF0772E
MEQRVHTLLRPAEVSRRTTLSRTTLWRLVRAQVFPAPIKLGAGNRIAFSEEAVGNWINQRKDASPR